MTWPVLAGVLGGIILLGGAVKAWPAVWSFVKALASMPLTVERVIHEFRPNGGNSLRDRVDRLTTDMEHLRGSNHHIHEQLTKVVLEARELSGKVDQHTKDDAKSFGVILKRLDGIEKPKAKPKAKKAAKR